MSDRERKIPYYFTYVWHTKNKKKIINELSQKKKAAYKYRGHRNSYQTGRGREEGKMGKGDQLNDGGQKPDFWWGAHCSVHSSRNTMLYT